jgi:2-C-methyl-D-erythritol 2,4-cyclodiphosphate synthase
MVLGGCTIAEGVHFVGHSDADVLLHAITDAVLSAAGLPDIGELFPNTDEANRGRDSAEMLALAMHQVRAAGWRVINIDTVIQLERPKLSPWKRDIQGRIAEVMQIEPESISLKGKTGEGVGEIGRGELATALCVALMERTTN